MRRPPSRRMPPPTPPTPMTGPGLLVLVGLAAWYLWLCASVPNFLAASGAFLAAIVVGTLAVNLGHRRHLEMLAADRPGESICTFARSFDRRATDTWILRAVFEGLQPWCRSGRVTLPLRRTDDLDDDLKIDREDLDDLACEMARRAGRSMARCEENPLFENARTVADLVTFLAYQPRIAG